MRDEDHRAAVARRASSSTSLRSGRGGWSARRAAGSWTGAGASWPAPGGCARRPRARRPACRPRRRRRGRRRAGRASAAPCSTVRRHSHLLEAAARGRATRPGPGRSSRCARCGPRARVPGVGGRPGQHLTERGLAGAVGDRRARRGPRARSRGRYLRSTIVAAVALASVPLSPATIRPLWAPGERKRILLRSGREDEALDLLELLDRGSAPARPCRPGSGSGG